MENQNHPVSHQRAMTLGTATSGVQKSPGKKATGLDRELGCLFDVFPGRKPPSLISLLHSNKPFIMAVDAELFMSGLVLRQA